MVAEGVGRDSRFCKGFRLNHMGYFCVVLPFSSSKIHHGRIRKGIRLHCVTSMFAYDVQKDKESKNSERPLGLVVLVGTKIGSFFGSLRLLSLTLLELLVHAKQDNVARHFCSDGESMCDSAGMASFATTLLQTIRDGNTFTGHD